MLKHVIAAVLFTCAASASRAAPVNYKFYFDHYSNARCPYLTLTVDGSVAAGYASYESSDSALICQKGDYAGGFISSGYTPKGVDFGVFRITRQTKVWMITTEDPNGIGIETVLLLDPADKTWAVAVPGPSGGPFSIVNAGTMTYTSTQ
jgi:hypothetical protein